MLEILKFLKSSGEKLDAEIAAETGLSLATVRSRMTELSTRGEVIMCHTIRYDNGKKVEGLLCRVAGYIPPVGPGRKSKAQPVSN